MSVTVRASRIRSTGAALPAASVVNAGQVSGQLRLAGTKFCRIHLIMSCQIASCSLADGMRVACGNSIVITGTPL